MTLWFVIALMTAAAAFAVLWPLGRRAALRGGSDVAVYRDQLDEIARDHAAGRIGEREAEAARTEVSRRLLHSADAQPLATAAGHALRRRLVALAALVLLPAGALAVYAYKGSPHLPDQPLSVRLDTPTEQSVPALVARVEAHLERNPEDGRGWEVLAPVYLRLGRYEEAAQARRNVVRLLGSTAAREADLGEALTGAANGVVTAEAKAAFERALALDASEFKARYFIGLAAEQDGRPAEAAAMWRALLDSAPPGATWHAFVQESLMRVDPNAPKPAAPGPSSDDVSAAEKLSPEQRMAMVQGMIDQLAERLKSDGRDVEGWGRLLRAYMVLGERDKAASAVAEARRALADDADRLRHLDALVKDLKIEG